MRSLTLFAILPCPAGSATFRGPPVPAIPSRHALGLRLHRQFARGSNAISKRLSRGLQLRESEHELSVFGGAQRM